MGHVSHVPKIVKKNTKGRFFKKMMAIYQKSSQFEERHGVANYYEDDDKSTICWPSVRDVLNLKKNMKFSMIIEIMIH